VLDVIKQDGLVHGYPAEDWKDGIEERCCLKPITIVSNDGENKKEDNKNKKGDFLFHASFIYMGWAVSLSRENLKNGLPLVQ
jgi:hypothetical protein